MYKVQLINLVMTPLGSYPFYDGCEKQKACDAGKSCVAADECSKCSFGSCLQLANGKRSAGFSYSLSQVCRLCTSQQLDTYFLETSLNWGVYKKKGTQKIFHFTYFVN